MTLTLEALAILLGYLIGATPTAYLLVRAVKGTDIRTLGSGNVGATNAGRALGAWGFLTVFLIDLLKGFLPTWGLPEAVRALADGPSASPSLAVLVGVATILGHNFPLYLRFKGGKGVATSLGVVIALDPVAAGGAAFGFVVFLLVTRIVSISSILAALIFAVLHFARAEEPWGPNHVVLSVAILLLLVMLIYRHRKNLVRIARGTEPRVHFGKRPKPPTGRAGIGLVLALTLVCLAVGTWLALKTQRPSALDCGHFSVVVTDRAQTGYQRAGRLTFLDRGRLVAVACPRYDFLVLYEVMADRTLNHLRDVKLAGKPVALWPTEDRLYVLQRPSGDARHLEPGFWRVYDFAGEPIGPRFPVGYDPDDLALISGDRVALVLLSGHAEGETNRPDPSLIAFELRPGATPRKVSEVVFDQVGDDPESIRLSDRESHAAVVLRGSNQCAGIDLSDPEHPRISGRLPLADRDVPHVSTTDDDQILVPVASQRDALPFAEPGASRENADQGRWFLASTLPDDSAIEISHLLTGRLIGRVPLRGPFNLGTVIPISLAHDPESGYLAVSDRSGGVHLVAIQGASAEDESRSNPPSR